MRRIDLMNKEEIVKFLATAHGGNCNSCPLEEICNELTGKDCRETVLNYLLEDVEMVQRASLYKTREEAFEKYFGDGLDEYCEADILDFADFLMEKVPKPLDK